MPIKNSMNYPCQKLKITLNFGKNTYIQKIKINNPVLSICGALLLAIATIAVNIPANIISPAYDLANLLPRLFNFKRGAIFSIILAFMFMPWIFMQKPEVFYGIINNIGALIGPATGIIMADFFIIRKQKLDVLEMFKVNGAYKYVKGFNPIALEILFLSTSIIFAGEFISDINWLYKYAWFVGLTLGFVFYIIAVYVVIRLRGKTPPEYEIKGTFGAENYR
jgi:NCS1 family nucleobase:cation symporter-1